MSKYCILKLRQVKIMVVFVITGSIFAMQLGCSGSLKSNVIESASKSTPSSSGEQDLPTSGNNNSGNSANNIGNVNQNCQVSTSTAGVVTVLHSRSQTFFERNEVVSPSKCQSQVRLCNNGNLSGSYTAITCSVKINSSAGAGTGTDLGSYQPPTTLPTTPSTTSTTLPSANTSLNSSYTLPILLSHQNGQSNVAGPNYSFLPAVDAAGQFVAFYGDSPTLTPDRGGWYNGGVIENLLTGQRRRIATVSSGGATPPCSALVYNNLQIQISSKADKIIFNNCQASISSLGSAQVLSQLNIYSKNNLSPDGSKLAFYDSANKNVFYINLNNSESAIKVNSVAAGSGIAMGNNWIAYCSEPAQSANGISESNDIYLKNINSNAVLSVGHGYCSSLQIAADDSRFIFSRNKSGSSFQTELVVFDINARTYNSLSLNQVDAPTYYHLSPDGRVLCFANAGGDLGGSEIKIYSFANRQVVSTHVHVDIYKTLKCSNNGDVIVFDTRTKFPGYTYPADDLQVYMIQRK